MLSDERKEEYMNLINMRQEFHTLPRNGSDENKRGTLL